MIPTLGVVAMGGRRWMVPLPLPLFLGWPLVLVPLGAAVVIERLFRSRAVGRSRPTVAGAVLSLVCQLSGLRVDIRNVRGVRLLIWLI